MATYTVKSGWVHEQGIGSRFIAKALVDSGSGWRVVATIEIFVSDLINIKEPGINIIGDGTRQEIETSGIDILQKKVVHDYGDQYTWNEKNHRFEDVFIPSR